MIYENINKFIALIYLESVRKKFLKQYPPVAVFAFDTIGSCIQVYGRQENHYLKYLEENVLGRIAGENSICLDVGANIGNHSLAFSKKFAKVLAFEPNPKTFHLLQYNSRIVDNISAYNFGASSKKAKFAAVENISNSGGTTIVENSADDAGEFWKEIEIECRKLDDEQDLIGSYNVAFIKMDVEGHELEALTGSRNILSKHSPVIAFEQSAHEFSDGKSPVISYLRSLDYQHFYSLELVSVTDKFDAMPRFVRRIFKTLYLAVGIDNTSVKAVKRTSFKPKHYTMLLASKSELNIA